MNVDGTKVRRLTNTLGYDGGPFFSPDGNWIVYRAHHPKSDEEIAHYKSLLAQGLVEPSEMDLYVMRADGSNQQQITKLPGASFAPSFFLDSQRIIFASNYEHPTTSQFELYTIGRDRSEEHTSELQSRLHLVCRLLLEKKKHHLDETPLLFPRTHRRTPTHPPFLLVSPVFPLCPDPGFCTPSHSTYAPTHHLTDTPRLS